MRFSEKRMNALAESDGDIFLPNPEPVFRKRNLPLGQTCTGIMSAASNAERGTLGLVR
jgi:hypothetical protein